MPNLSVFAHCTLSFAGILSRSAILLPYIRSFPTWLGSLLQGVPYSVVLLLIQIDVCLFTRYVVYQSVFACFKPLLKPVYNGLGMWFNTLRCGGRFWTFLQFTSAATSSNPAFRFLTPVLYSLPLYKILPTISLLWLGWLSPRLTLGLMPPPGQPRTSRWDTFSTPSPCTGRYPDHLSTMGGLSP